jgi:hypothetical protein
MDKKLKAKWVKALRSGKYEQGKEVLVDNKGKYCCLGVLCHIAKYHSIDTSLIVDNNWDCAIISEEDQLILSAANDEHGWTFDEIADYVEVML